MNSCLVLGAGVNGMFSALALARAGLRVVLLERGATGRESSWAGAGILSLLLPWNYPETVRRMANRGRALWPAWADALQESTGIDPEYRPCGMVVLGEEAATALAWRQDQGEAAGDLPASLFGVLADRTNALWLPEVAQARNPRILAALRRALELAGVEIREQEPGARLLRDGSCIKAVETSGRRYEADAFVVAAGAWSGGLFADLGEVPQIQPVRGQILLLQADPETLPCVVYRRGQYLVPRRDGLVLVGSTLEHVGFDRATTPEARISLQAFADEVVPGLRRANIVAQWSGFRPGSPGNLPTVDRHPTLENLYLNSGHFRYGVTMAPASVEVLLHRMLGTPCPIDPAPYAWRRDAAA